MKKMNKKGFTLIEMLAVIAIIAVLVAIIVPAVGSSTTKAAAAADAANLRSITAEAAIDYLDNNCTGLTDATAYTMDSKYWNKDALTVTFYAVDGTLVGTITDGTTVASVEYFSAIAEDGDTTNATAFSTTGKTAVATVSSGT